MWTGERTAATVGLFDVTLYGDLISGGPTGRMLLFRWRTGCVSSGWKVEERRESVWPTSCWNGLTDGWIFAKYLKPFVWAPASVSRPSDELINVCR